ncbi:MAG: hypothetical protein QW172_04610 [Candidatus Bathyarchaeia archaeon]
MELKKSATLAPSARSPPSISILAPLGNMIKVESPCPTSKKYTRREVLGEEGASTLNHVKLKAKNKISIAGARRINVPNFLKP